MKIRLSTIPSPEELISQNRPSILHRVKTIAGHLRHSGKFLFIVGFALFVLAGALIILFLEGGEEGGPFSSLFQALWFTVVTITTVGYGDISPSKPSSQIWAMIIMLVGIGLVGIITGSVASVLVESNRKRALGLVALKKLQNHIVVCGWKNDIRNILLGILETNRWLSAFDLVLVTTHPPNEVGELTRDRKLRGMHFVFGSHTDRTVLEMARVETAQRVIILADESAQGGRSDPDSRTVLSATTVEAMNRVVYTCTEIVQPHFIPYLRPAGVEEVVLGEVNARAILSAASLGDGISNAMTRFLPEFGEQLRVMPVPPSLKGGAYEELARQARSKGYIPLGLLEKTGRLHDRKRERIREALKHPEYQRVVDALRSAANLASNVPRIHPPSDQPVGQNAKILVLLPGKKQQSQQQKQDRKAIAPLSRKTTAQQLFICGWKTNMADLLEDILKIHQTLGRRLSKVTMVARLPAAEQEQIKSRPALRQIIMIEGEPTDPAVLGASGVGEAHRALILTDPEAERKRQEADARNLMISFAIDEINPSVYKCVEIVNSNFADHFRIANVEEAIYTQQYQRMMLVQASLGTGISSSLSTMFDPSEPTLRVVDFPGGKPGLRFEEYGEGFSKRGSLLIGLIEHSGNDHNRNKEYLYQAQIQPRIQESIDRLVQLKTLFGNEAVLNPDGNFIPGKHSRAVVIVPNSITESSG